MKKSILYFSLCLCLTAFVNCTSDNSDNDDVADDAEDQLQGTILGEWTAISIGIVFDDESEESENDPCGTSQKFRFSSDGTFEVDDYLLNNSNCEFNETRTGEIRELSDSQFPEANYVLTIGVQGAADQVRRPEITFDGNDLMRVQYPWPGSTNDNIAYSFKVYQRD